VRGAPRDRSVPRRGAARLRGLPCRRRSRRSADDARDLVEDLPALAAEAPSDATLVVFHSAVLAYVSTAQRAAFDLPEPPPTDLPARSPAGPPPALLVRDGRRPLAWVDGHGTWLQWLG